MPFLHIHDRLCSVFCHVKEQANVPCYQRRHLLLAMDLLVSSWSPRFPETCQIFKRKKTLFLCCFEETSICGKIHRLLCTGSSITVFYPILCFFHMCLLVQGLLSTTIDVQPYMLRYVQTYMDEKRKETSRSHDDLL